MAAAPGQPSRFSAAFRIVRKGDGGGGGLYVGVARRNADVEQRRCYNTGDFWGIHSGEGYLHHNGASRARLYHSGSNGSDLDWRGRQGYREGDTIELHLDAASGILGVIKNRQLLGVAAGRGVLPVGEELCWAVACGQAGSAIHVESTDPAAWPTLPALEAVEAVAEAQALMPQLAEVQAHMMADGFAEADELQQVLDEYMAEHQHLVARVNQIAERAQGNVEGVGRPAGGGPRRAGRALVKPGRTTCVFVCTCSMPARSLMQHMH